MNSLLFVCLCVLAVNYCPVFCVDYFLKRDNSLTPPYTGQWASYGVTMFTSNFVRLTSDTKSEFGGIYNVRPLESRDWEVHISFKVHGNTGALFGDGFAFWFVQDFPTKSGYAFGAPEKFRGLGVFFDTYSNHNGEHNHEHPYISAMVSDGTATYDHDRDGTVTELAGCSCSFRNKNFETLVAIRYSNNTLKISSDVENLGKWKECFNVSDVYLPTGYHLALSAATGDLSDNHDIIYLKTYELALEYTDNELKMDRSKIRPSSKIEILPRERIEDEPTKRRASSWSWVKWFLVVIVMVVFMILSFFLYQYFKDRENRRKRLF